MAASSSTQRARQRVVKTPLSLEQAAGQTFLLSFVGKTKPPQEFIDLLRAGRVGGVVLFRHKNMGTLEDLRTLTSFLQNAAREAGQPPLLIAADQEGGQLMAVGECTPFPGNMALGATGSEKLAYRTGQAMGKELSALGINVDFAPVCDVNNNPLNPVIGTRAFGEDPRLVAKLSAAMVRGLQRSGVAATAKHFPGHGDTSGDSHTRAPVLKHTPRRIQSLELVPFRAAIAAGARLVMTAHIVIPSLNGGHRDVPATLSPGILRGLLRKKLRFEGVIVSDALDMHALDQGEALIAEVLAAAAAGNDLLLFTHDLSRVEPAFRNLVQAARRGLLAREEVENSAKRILALKKWLGKQRQFPTEVIRSKEHLQLAREVAERSITLVRDRSRLLPLRPSPDTKIAVLLPRPEDLTPADTSSYVRPVLAESLRCYHGNVEEFSFALKPSPNDVNELIARLQHYDLVIVGTIDANTYRGQAELVKGLLSNETKVIAVALRLPYDLSAFPDAPTYLCSYSIMEPAMHALADALFGRIPFRGRLPVKLPQNRR